MPNQCQSAQDRIIYRRLPRKNILKKKNSTGVNQQLHFRQPERNDQSTIQSSDFALVGSESLPEHRHATGILSKIHPPRNTRRSRTAAGVHWKTAQRNFRPRYVMSLHNILSILNFRCNKLNHSCVPELNWVAGHKGVWGNGGIQPFTLTSALYGNGRLTYWTFRTWKKGPSSHWIFCWMDSGAGLQAVEKKKIHSLFQSSSPYSHYTAWATSLLPQNGAYESQYNNVTNVQPIKT